jgi:hypothetical protein
MPSSRILLCVLLLAACSNESTKNDGGVQPSADAALGDVSTTGLPTDGGAADAAATDAASTDAAAAAPTFTQVYAIIISKCTPCHTTATGIGISLGHLDMTTQANAYMNLVNTAAMGTQCGGKGTRVTPGNEMTSIMYLKVSLDDPTPCGSKMPLGLPPLSQDETDTIENWIKAGAMNN